MGDNIAGKVVVITGATSGLGEATARHLSAGVRRVVLSARRADKSEALGDCVNQRDESSEQARAHPVLQGTLPFTTI